MVLWRCNVFSNPYEERVIERASAFDFSEGVSITTASAEDMLVLKAFAGREQDWSDVEGILVRQRRKVDVEYVRAELTPLSQLKEDPAIVDRFERLYQELSHD